MPTPCVTFRGSSLQGATESADNVWCAFGAKIQKHLNFDANYPGLDKYVKECIFGYKITDKNWRTFDAFWVLIEKKTKKICSSICP